MASDPSKKSYWIPVWNGIFEHYASLGEAVWLLLWYIDRTTREVEQQDGTRFGLVLGFRPVRDAEIAREFGCVDRTIRRWRNRLARLAYISLDRTAQGFRVTVLKSKKWRTRDGHQ